MIVFVAEMRNPKTKASSTQIMTRNLLYGFSQLQRDTIFVPVIADIEDKADIAEYYSGLYSEIIFAIEKSKHKNNVILRQISWLHNAWVPPETIVPENILNIFEENEDVILISQSPSVDAAILCMVIKRRFPKIKYIQYWGDPLALSLITPEQYSIKRLLLKAIEKCLHNCADSICYGTESLYAAEVELFPEISGKSYPCRVAYMPEAMNSSGKNERIRFGYYGNYYQSIRNILPLYKAFANVKGAELVICGSSDLTLENTPNVQIVSRIPQSEVEEQEAKLDVEVCVLNSVGIQIPGKIFYHSNTEKKILVILDGPRKEKIRQELAKSERFIFCENNVQDIQRVVLEILDGKYSDMKYDHEYYSPKVVCKQIIGEIVN